MTGLPPWPYPRLAAHRGAGKLAPENTLAALRVGHAHGYRDGRVRRQAVGRRRRVPAARRHARAHDERARARRRAAVARARAARRRRLAFAAVSRASRCRRSPPIARWAARNGVACNIEIKPTPGRERETGAAVALDAAALWTRRRRAAAAVVVLRRRARCRARGGARAAARVADRRALPTTGAIGSCDSECIALDAKHTLLTQDLVARRTRARACAWRRGRSTIRTRAAELASWGVDTIITDAIDLIAPDSLPAQA